MKNKGKLWLIIGLLAILVGTVIYAMNQEKAVPVSHSPLVEERNVSGTIIKMEDQKITLSMQGETQEFKIEHAEKHGYETLALKDLIEIKYQQDDTLPIQNATYITMMKPYEDIIQSLLENMSLEEKVGQMIMARCPGEEKAKEDIETYHLGSYMLFAKDVYNEDKASLTKKLATYQEQAKIPMLFTIDEEGGSVNRLSTYEAFRELPFSSPQDLYEEGGIELILANEKEKAELLTSLGIQVNLAPVADVSVDEEDFINARSFGQDATATAAYISQVVQAAKENSIGTTLKHFPGYGDNVDTHTGIAYDDRPYENFVNSDFLPFQAGIEAGADAILVAHNVVSSMDETMPASLSKNVHDILREELSFEGVIMCDDLDMQAIQQFANPYTSAVEAIQAGNDMVLCSNYASQIPAILYAVRNNEIPEERIDASVKRILTWKDNLSMLDKLK